MRVLATFVLIQSVVGFRLLNAGIRTKNQFDQGQTGAATADMKNPSGSLVPYNSENRIVPYNSEKSIVPYNSEKRIVPYDSPSGSSELRGSSELLTGEFDMNSSLDSEHGEHQLALVRQNLSVSENSSDLLTASMVSSSFEDLDFEDVAVIEREDSRIVEFNPGSGAIEYQLQLAPSSNVWKMHLISTKLKFLPGGMKKGLKECAGDEAKAKKYGEALASPEDCNTIAKQLKELQDDTPGSKYVICISVGTSAKPAELEKEGRPEFAKNRALNVKKHLLEAMEAAGAVGEIKEPMVQYRKDRTAAFLMKSFTGTEPPCDEKELTIPDIKRRKH